MKTPELKLPSCMSESEIKDMHANVIAIFKPDGPRIKHICNECQAPLSSYELLKKHSFRVHGIGLPATLLGPNIDKSSNGFEVGFEVGYDNGTEISYITFKGAEPTNDHGIVIGAEYKPKLDSIFSFNLIVLGVLNEVVSTKCTAGGGSLWLPGVEEFLYDFELVKSKTTPVIDIRVGDVYTNSNGNVKILKVNEHDIYFQLLWGDRGFHYHPPLSFLAVYAFVRHADIPEDVPKFDYDIPVGQYIAMDKGGAWYRYHKHPKISTGIHFHPTGVVLESHDSETPPWHDWKESLHKMTENGLVKV